VRKKAIITLSQGVSAPSRSARPNPRGKAKREIETAAQVPREAKATPSPQPGFSLVASEPGRARLKFNETVSVAAALGILELLRKDREHA
jgi:hypothetical protein